MTFSSDPKRSSLFLLSTWSRVVALKNIFCANIFSTFCSADFSFLPLFDSRHPMMPGRSRGRYALPVRYSSPSGVYRHCSGLVPFDHYWWSSSSALLPSGGRRHPRSSPSPRPRARGRFLLRPRHSVPARCCRGSVWSVSSALLARLKVEVSSACLFPW